MFILVVKILELNPELNWEPYNCNSTMRRFHHAINIFFMYCITQRYTSIHGKCKVIFWQNVNLECMIYCYIKSSSRSNPDSF